MLGGMPTECNQHERALVTCSPWPYLNIPTTVFKLTTPNVEPSRQHIRHCYGLSIGYFCRNSVQISNILESISGRLIVEGTERAR